MSKHIRVAVETRDQLRRLAEGREDGPSYSQVIAWKAGVCYGLPEPVNTVDVNTGRNAETTTIRVSEDCHEYLARLNERWDVNTLGEVVATLAK